MVKFDWEVITKPLPAHIAYCWIAFLGITAVWTWWKFFYRSNVRLGFGDRKSLVDDSGIELPGLLNSSIIGSVGNELCEEGSSVSFRLADLVDSHRDVVIDKKKRLID